MYGGLLNPRVYKPTKSYWWLKSKNKKWCDRGSFIYRGMKGIPVETSYRIEELKYKLGDPPEDLEWGFVLGWKGWVGYYCFLPYFRLFVEGIVNRVLKLLR